MGPFGGEAVILEVSGTLSFELVDEFLVDGVVLDFVLSEHATREFVDQLVRERVREVERDLQRHEAVAVLELKLENQVVLDRLLVLLVAQVPLRRVQVLLAVDRVRGLEAETREGAIKQRWVRLVVSNEGGDGRGGGILRHDQDPDSLPVDGRQVLLLGLLDLLEGEVGLLGAVVRDRLVLVDRLALDGGHAELLDLLGLGALLHRGGLVLLLLDHGERLLLLLDAFRRVLLRLLLRLLLRRLLLRLLLARVVLVGVLVRAVRVGGGQHVVLVLRRLLEHLPAAVQVLRALGTLRAGLRGLRGLRLLLHLEQEVLRHLHGLLLRELVLVVLDRRVVVLLNDPTQRRLLQLHREVLLLRLVVEVQELVAQQLGRYVGGVVGKHRSDEDGEEQAAREAALRERERESE